MKLFAVLVAAMLSCHLAYGARLENPYIAEIPVASQSAADRTAAEREGLLLVLERLSGQRLDGNAQINGVLHRPESALAQFAYVQEPSTAEVKNSAPMWRLQMVFAQAVVEKMLQEAGIPLWPLERPQVLLLMMDAQNHWLPSREHFDNDKVVLQRLGNNRGVPLLLQDNADADITVVAAAQSLDAAALMPQAEQQGANALLLGSVRGGDDKGWSGQWKLHFKNQEQALQTHAATLPLLVDAALRSSAEFLSASYRSSVAADTGGSAQLRLQIDNVRTYSAFMALRQYLEKLDAVQRIIATQINGSVVVVDVEVKGRESFRSLLELSQSLQWQEEITPPVGDGVTTKPVWHYRWVE